MHDVSKPKTPPPGWAPPKPVAAPRAATEPLLSREQVVAAFAAHEGNDCCDPRTLEHVFQTLTGNTLGRAS